MWLSNPVRLASHCGFLQTPFCFTANLTSDHFPDIRENQSNWNLGFAIYNTWCSCRGLSAKIDLGGSVGFLSKERCGSPASLAQAVWPGSSSNRADNSLACTSPSLSAQCWEQLLLLAHLAPHSQVWRLSSRIFTRTGVGIE